MAVKLKNNIIKNFILNVFFNLFYIYKQANKNSIK